MDVFYVEARVRLDSDAAPVPVFDKIDEGPLGFRKKIRDCWVDYNLYVPDPAFTKRFFEPPEYLYRNR